MTDPQNKRFSAARARAVVKAQRWAMKHRPKPPPRRPWPVVTAVLAGALVAGVTLGTLLDSSGVLRGAPPVDEQPPSRSTGAAESADTWVVALVPDSGADADSTTALTPGAGPLKEMGEGGFAYEEPLAQDEPAPDPSDHEIEAMMRRAGLADLVAPESERPALPLWRKNALDIGSVHGRPMIAVVVDDLGVNWRTTPLAIALPGPLTMSFMTYARNLEALSAEARAAGHELMLHVPMEPSDPQWDPGPNVLRVDHTPDELSRRLDWALGRLEGYVGINNHMGSRFTTSLLGMAQVLSELKARGLIFLDSKTSGRSVATGLARRMGVAYVSRDIFIDNDPDSEKSIHRQLAKLEDIARRHGHAVGIAHPHDKTLEVLTTWLPEVQGRGFVLVPISAIVRRRIALAAQGAESEASAAGQ